ncbi:hypothetical protein QS713_07990 [Gleimia hominis]|uniref:Transcriptional regulator n=1 Tax=Gleimia hominis TaxID=595468 RepID=A0ABU3IC87_9ACTO|nr:hypothetical protein [Gleimia hominis]MDT3767995.1 hypothetical protein [Gleimia hominis]
MTKSGKKRRRAVQLSKVDEQALAQGRAPSWEQIRPTRVSHEVQREARLTPRDKQILADVPPHWQVH